MTTIKTWFSNYNFNDFLKEQYSTLKNAGVVLHYEKPYDAEKNYKKNDTITIQDADSFEWFYYTSLQDDNMGHAYTDTTYWQKGAEITDIFTEDNFLSAKDIAQNLNFFVLNKNVANARYKQLLILCLSSNIYATIAGMNAIAVNSSSIDGMSIGGELIGDFKQFPWLNNKIGLQYLVLRSQLIGLSDIYGKSYHPIQTVTTRP